MADKSEPYQQTLTGIHATAALRLGLGTQVANTPPVVLVDNPRDFERAKAEGRRIASGGTAQAIQNRHSRQEAHEELRLRLARLEARIAEGMTAPTATAAVASAPSRPEQASSLRRIPRVGDVWLQTRTETYLEIVFIGNGVALCEAVGGRIRRPHIQLTSFVGSGSYRFLKHNRHANPIKGDLGADEGQE